MSTKSPRAAQIRPPEASTLAARYAKHDAAARRLRLSGALTYLTLGGASERQVSRNELGGTTTSTRRCRPDPSGFLVETSTVITDATGEVIRNEFQRVWTKKD